LGEVGPLALHTPWKCNPRVLWKCGLIGYPIKKNGAEHTFRFEV
jgi:hypothetical protein